MKSSIHRARQFVLRKQNDRRLKNLAGEVLSRAKIDPNKKPVIFFNASTRLGGISLNGAFATLSAMALQLRGVPVHYFGCRAGLHRCTLGVVVRGAESEPPCRTCIAQSEALYAHAPVEWFVFQEDLDLAAALGGKTVGALENFSWNGIPLGPLSLPSLRWVLRIHHLVDDEKTRTLFQSFIQSAFTVVRAFDSFLQKTDPQCVVVFNGVSFPEGAARWVAQSRDIRVVTHEVAHQPLTAFFSDGQVTAYPVNIPDDFELNEAQNKKLDGYLEKRFQGNFSMAGVQFWPEMKPLDENLQAKIEAHKQLVPIFSNVIFDTSQIHANVVFEHMFAWLDQILEIIKAHPDTLFVIRAHPDELRPGKSSAETVRDWVKNNAVEDLPNVAYIDPLEYVSSYALIQQAKFVMSYNSTIGLESALMGKTVLNGGKARYTQVECVHLPKTPDEHRKLALQFLAVDTLEIPETFAHNARRFQYYQLWRTPLLFEEFIEPNPTRGYIDVKDFPIEALIESETMNVIAKGILDGEDFLMPEGG